ncbi:MAG: periplasmic heavy metal sensor, partial [Desulfobacteraceae bacterium]|nr:periplasmic heavy metal sensor [Desulfobacteraceae bacterium]
SLTLAAPAWAYIDDGAATPGCRMMGGSGMGMGPGMMMGGMMGMQRGCMMGECWRGGMGGPMMGRMGMMGGQGLGMTVHRAFREINTYQAKAQALGLNEGQLQRLDTLEEALATAVIKGRADMEIAGLDLRRAMSQETPDLKKADEAVNRKTETWKAIQKNAINAVAEARKVLTPEQRQKVRGLTGPPGRMMMPMAPGAAGQ